MWLYVPSACAPARPELNSACMLPESNAPLSATWNAKPMRRRTLPGLLTRAPYLMRLSGLTCEPSAMQTSALSWKASNLICSAADTPANPSPSPAGSVARMILATYGPGLLRRLARIGRQSAFLRMSQPTLDLGIPKCEPTFEEWATELRKDCSRRAKLARAIVENGCLSLRWRTPNSQEPGISVDRLDGALGARCYDKDTGRLAQVGLTQQVQMFDAKNWPTPRTQCTRGNGTPRNLTRDLGMYGIEEYVGHKANLEEVVAMWPTPNARDADKWSNRPIGHLRQMNLSGAAQCRFSRPAPANLNSGQESSPTTRTSRPRLNPAFVGWLMGFPLMWADIEVTNSGFMAMQLSRWLPRMRGYFYGLICSMVREGGNGW